VKWQLLTGLKTFQNLYNVHPFTGAVHISPDVLSKEDIPHPIGSHRLLHTGLSASARRNVLAFITLAVCADKNSRKNATNRLQAA
jgi:hypothetical protein